MRRDRIHWRGLAMAAFALLGTAATAWAQENGDGGGDGGGDQSVSFAEMFFLSKDVARGELNLLGSFLIWILLLMSIATIALVIHFLLQNRRTTMVPDDLVGDLEDMLGDRKFRDAIQIAEDDESVFGEVMHAALTEASNGYGAMERAIEETSDLASSRKLRSLELLNVLGAVGPMVGLFGTVYGMIVAFWTIVDAGGQPKPAELAAGISTALVTTFWGLVVGIPAVAAAALIRARIEALITESMIEAEALIGRFRPGGAKKTPGKSAAAPATPKPKAE